VIVFRHVDRRRPFLWESDRQPAGRWHAAGEGPAHYFAETPDAAWAEFLRHEGITDPADLAGVSRSLWAIELAEPPTTEPGLSDTVMTGDHSTYRSCQAEARRLRGGGATGLIAPSAAVSGATGSGFRTDGGLRRGPRRPEHVFVLFGTRPDLVGWAACADGRPREDLLVRVRHFPGTRRLPA
jgi:RES domain